MRRQQQLSHGGRSETHQFNLFATESGSSTTPVPEWLMLPEPTRQALTSLMTRLICDHAASDHHHHHHRRKVGHDV